MTNTSEKHERTQQGYLLGGRVFLKKKYLCVFQGVEVVVSVWGPTGPG